MPKTAAETPAPGIAAVITPIPVPTASPAPHALRLEEPVTGGLAGSEPAGAPGTHAHILHQIRALEGVAGAFLATADGLLIAAELPDPNGNILAAFAPTVFTQLAKYADLAHLGAPESVDLHLTGANIHVRKIGKIFLGVLTPHGRLLPLPELNLIAAALQPHVS
jgi:predicted regulator of Ras-like GTPase activity (Roadblock/LC7/MglB family)